MAVVDPMSRVEAFVPLNMYQRWVVQGNKMLSQSPRHYILFIAQEYPQVMTALRESARISTQILPYQAAALFEHASHCNCDGDEILAIGTGDGYAAAIMSQAAPKAHIVALTPDTSEVSNTRKNLREYPNVDVICASSRDYLESYEGPALQMIFVDSDHNHAPHNVWYNHLVCPHFYGAGFMLFHGYVFKHGRVVQAVDDMAVALGRGPTYLLVDEGRSGMAGFLRLEGDEV